MTANNDDLRIRPDRSSTWFNVAWRHIHYSFNYSLLIIHYSFEAAFSIHAFTSSWVGFWRSPISALYFFLMSIIC